MSPFISRNVNLGKPLKLSSWRKVAIGTWHAGGDPSVYGILELDADPAIRYLEALRAETGIKLTLTHFVGKAVAEAIRRHPEINCILRFGRLYPRKSIDVFFQVASDDSGEDLSGMTIRNADQKSLVEIGTEMVDRVRAIRQKRDQSFTKMKKTMGGLPGFLARAMVNFSGFFMYGLNLWTPLLGVPRDPFGSVMVTNIGSLGLDTAFAPLVPYSRVPLLFAVGVAADAPVARNGAVVVAKRIKLCATFDHRLIDGMHAARMTRALEKIFAEPEKELKS